MIYLRLFLTFLEIGAFTFGGGYAMLPLIQQKLIENEWMSVEEIVNFIAISESTPGVFAVNCATYVGKTVGGVTGFWGGFFGAVCATVGVVLPSFVILLLVSRVYTKFRENFVVRSCMSGLKPAVIGLLAAAVLSIGKTVFFPSGVSLSVLAGLPFWLSLAVCALAFFGAEKKVHPIFLIAGGAAVGLVLGYAGLLPDLT
ncbi:MAG: chromate transporter [Ruminococcus sp.]|nr:chromate transporter [Candidatus Apopatosoma intestinale]